MAVYMVRTRDVFVLGKGWWGQTIGNKCTLPKDVPATRDAILDWLDTNAGDFQSVTDFAASIEDVEIPWAEPENEDLWYDLDWR